MNPSSIVDTTSNISKELFNYILIDITTSIVNIDFNTNYLPEEVDNYICFKDGDERNLDVNNMVLLISCYQQIHLNLYIDLIVLDNL